MGKLVVTEFITVDGVIEDPGGAERFERGGWAFQFDRGAEGDKFKLDEVLAAEALLLGRITYEGFAQAWPSMSDKQGFAAKMNSMPKYVVSATLENPSWSNTTQIKDDVVGEITALKERTGGDVLVNGSAQLVRILSQHDLVDEYRLMIFPVVLGEGKRLFADGEPPRRLALHQYKAVGDCLILIYELARERAAQASA
ncbi:MAG: dihydrofolate reductase family protein [Actinomycetota bacterium]|nr:dihydrofolate reductase family protein [Actinomycetota bacterium]